MGGYKVTEIKGIISLTEDDLVDNSLLALAKANVFCFDRPN